MRFAFGILAFIFIANQSLAAILVEEKGVNVQKYNRTPESQYLDSTYSFRTSRRVGVDFSTASNLGMLGIGIELNFATEDAFRLGFGGGPGYKSAGFGWKHAFDGRYFAPYTTVQFSRWYSPVNGSKAVGETNPTYLGTQFLTDEQKRTGEYALHFLSAGFGMQYSQLDGPYQGMSLFAEIILLGNLERSTAVPTGSLGVGYFF